MTAPIVALISQSDSKPNYWLHHHHMNPGELWFGQCLWRSTSPNFREVTFPAKCMGPLVWLVSAHNFSRLVIAVQWTWWECNRTLLMDASSNCLLRAYWDIMTGINLFECASSTSPPPKDTQHYSLIAFAKRVTFWLQRVRSLPCACAYVALFAGRFAYNHFGIAHTYNAANTHAQGSDPVRWSQNVTVSSKAIGV